MYQGTTPTLILMIEGIDLTQYTVQVSFRTGTGEIMNKVEPQIGISVQDGNSLIFIPFTQAETLQLPVGVCQVQVRYVNAQGYAFVSEAATLDVRGIMTKNIIEYREVDEE